MNILLENHKVTRIMFLSFPSVLHYSYPLSGISISRSFSSSCKASAIFWIFSAYLQYSTINNSPEIFFKLCDKIFSGPPVPHPGLPIGHPALRVQHCRAPRSRRKLALRHRQESIIDLVSALTC